MRFPAWIFAVWLISALTLRAADASSAFDSANRLYEQGKFTEAISAYEQLLQSGTASAAIYFNLGNAFYKSGQIGRALAAYRQAEHIAPRDPDLRANVRFLRGQIQGPTRAPGRLQRGLATLTINEWAAFTAIVFWIWLLLLAVTQLRPRFKQTLRGIVIVLGLGVVTLAICLGAVLSAHSRQIVIVVSPNTVARSGPIDDSRPAFNLADGAEVDVLDIKDGWLQISPGGRRLGWLKRDQVISTPAPGQKKS